MTIENPLVTVYIPTFNRLELLQRAVKSVQDQTYQNIEIIIVDDCSIDGTQDYLVQLAREDSRIRYFLKEKNSGACASRNIAINNANGKFITGLDDDDYFLNNRIKKFLEKWEDEKIVFLYSINIVKNKYKLVFPSVLKKIFFKREINHLDLRIANYPGNQIFTLTKTLKEINGFDEKMPAWQDMETWYRVLKENKGVAKHINNISYVCDISHSHERITNIEKHRQARDIFVDKHKLDKKERKLFFQIEAHKLQSDKLIKRLIAQFSIIDLFYLLKNIGFK